MNDDMDGVDWAESFSGPDDDEIERLRDQESQDVIEAEPDYDSQVRIRRRHEQPREIEDSGYRYPSFEAAANRAKERSSPGYTYRVEAVVDGWVLRSTPVPEADRLAEEECDQQSRLHLGHALFYALATNDREYALELLERPLDVNVIGPTGSSPILVAAQRGYAEICETLLGLGAAFQIEIAMPIDQNHYETNHRADTVMERALRSQDWPTVEVISKVYVAAEWKWLRGNVPESDFSYFGYPRLVEAARYGMSALCAEMIGCGVDTDGDRLSTGYEPPIEAAFSNDQISTCFLLAAMGADISPLRNLEGFTAELAETLTNVSKYCHRAHSGTPRPNFP